MKNEKRDEAWEYEGYSGEDGSNYCLKLEVASKVVDGTYLVKDPKIWYMPNHPNYPFLGFRDSDGVNAYYTTKEAWLLSYDDNYTPNDDPSRSVAGKIYYKPDCDSYEYVFDIISLVTKGMTNNIRITNVNGYGYTIEVKQITVDYYFGEAEVKSKDKGLTEILFEDDFEDGVADGWTEGPGTWTVEGGSYVYSKLDENTVQHTYSLVTKLTVTDFIAEVKLKQLTTTYRDSGIQFWHQDSNNYYYANFDRDALGLWLFKGGSYVLVHGKSHNYDVTQRHTVKIVVQGTDFKMYVDGKLEWTDTLSEWFSGGIGLHAHRDSYTQFDDVKVWRTFDLHFTSSFHVVGTETGGVMVTIDNLASSFGAITVTDVVIHGVTPRDAYCTLTDHGIGGGIDIQPSGSGSFYVCLAPSLWKGKANVHLWVHFTTNFGTHHIGVNVMFRA